MPGKPDPLDSNDEPDSDLDEDIQLPAGADRFRFDQDVLDDDALVDRQPDYGDLIDAGWIDRAAQIEELDDDKVNPLDIGFTLDLNDSRADDELGQMIDIDVGSLLTPLPNESESDRDAARDVGSSEAAFGVGALHELLLPNASDAHTGEDESIDDEQFPAFDDAPVPSSSRTNRDEASEHEGMTDEDAPG